MKNNQFPGCINEIMNDFYRPYWNINDLYVVDYPYSFAHIRVEPEHSTDESKKVMDRLCNFIIKHRNESN